MATDRRDFIRFWSGAFVLFQIFCITSIDLNVPRIKWSPRLILITVWHSCISIALLCITIYVFRFLIPSIIRFELNILLDIMLIVSMLLTNFVCLVESLILRSNQMQIVTDVERISDIFETQLNVRVDFKRLRRRLVYKCWATYLISFSITATTIGLSFEEFIGDWLIIFYSFQLILMRKIQMTFYVDLMVEMMLHLRLVLVDVGRNEEGKTLRTLLWIKFIYSRLVKIVALVNRTFGWSMMVIMLQNILDLLNCIYWMLIYIYVVKSKRDLISKLLHGMGTFNRSLLNLCFFLRRQCHLWCIGDIYTPRSILGVLSLAKDC